MMKENCERAMKGNEVGAVLFDLDGVLVDSESEYTRIWNCIEEEYPTGVEGFALKIKGTNLENILDTYFPDKMIRRAVEARLYQLEGEMVYRYCNGAKQLLNGLREEGVPMALYTSSNHFKMEHLFRDIPELKSYFKAIVTGDDVIHSKPNPEGYLLAAEKLGVAPCQCVVVEDSLQGAKAGKAAGCKVVGIAGTLARATLAEVCDLVANGINYVTADMLAHIVEEKTKPHGG